MRAFAIDGGEVEQPQLNLTPLVDVVFVILIMFICIAPLLDVDQIELAEGVKESTAAVTSHAISVHIRKDDSILVNQRAFRLESLAQELRRLKSQEPGEVPQVICDKRASFGTFQSVKNSLQQAGFLEAEVVLKPQ